MSSSLAYPNMDQVRQHMVYERQTPADGSVTDFFTCKFCNKKFQMKIKGPGGRQKVTNSRTVKAHLKDKHNVMPAMLDVGVIETNGARIKALLNQHQGSWEKVPLSLVKEWAIGHGAQEKCFEEYSRIIREKIGDAAAEDFEKYYDQEKFKYGVVDMMGKGAWERYKFDKEWQEFGQNLRRKVAKACHFPLVRTMMSTESADGLFGNKKKKITFYGSVIPNEEYQKLFECVYPIPDGEVNPLSDDFEIPAVVAGNNAGDEEKTTKTAKNTRSAVPRKTVTTSTSKPTAKKATKKKEAKKVVPKKNVAVAAAAAAGKKKKVAKK